MALEGLHDWKGWGELGHSQGMICERSEHVWWAEARHEATPCWRAKWLRQKPSLDSRRLSVCVAANLNYRFDKHFHLRCNRTIPSVSPQMLVKKKVSKSNTPKDTVTKPCKIKTVTSYSLRTSAKSLLLGWLASELSLLKSG
jgi:hypothetical protein